MSKFDGSTFGYDYDAEADEPMQRGFKFAYPMNYRGLEIKVPARVVKVLDGGKRVVSFEDPDMDKKVLSTEDILHYEELPKHKYTLRVGDKITYYTRAIVPGTRAGVHTEVVTTIAESAFKDTNVRRIITANMYHKVEGYFQVVESEHQDAPPKGKWMVRHQVNLEIGKLENSDEIRKERRRKSAELVRQSKMGKVGQEMFTSVHAAKFIDRVMADHTNEDVNLEEEHGEAARRMMANGGFSTNDDSSE